MRDSTADNPDSLLSAPVDLFSISSRPHISMPADMATRPMILAAESLARAHHSQYDPSHDFHHVARVRSLSLSIANSLPTPPDLLVVNLAALFHDLLDRKYLPKEMIEVTAQDHLAGFWALWPGAISEERQRLVERVVENVSYTKEVKRIREGKQTDWHKTCLELHCVQDADKIDAIGAFGILRCAAYSAVSSRPLYLPANSGPTTSTSSSAIDHFREKLFSLHRMMKTAKGREIAERRTDYMHAFVAQVELEWKEVEEGNC
ncbi:hypothetical protein RQP46_002755 [Phenoliferia psychrophenolica]